MTWWSRSIISRAQSVNVIRFDQKVVPCLLMPCTGAASWLDRCSILESDVSGLYRKGDIIVGGLFPVHVYRTYHELTFKKPPPLVTCNTFVPLIFQWVQSLLLAVEEINSSESLLPNLSLAVQVSDSCASPGRALEGGSWLLTGRDRRPVPNYRCKHSSSPLGGVIGDSSSANSLALARLLGLYNYPQISYFSTSSILSDRTQFPSFFRTVPSDTFQSQGLAQLVSYFGWTWVGLLAENTDYGLDGIRATKTEILRSGACVAFTEYILTSRRDRNAQHISKVIRESNANAIVVFSSGSNLLPVVEELLRWNVTGKTWVASESWSTSALVSKEKYWSVLKGTIGFALHSGQIPAFNEFLNANDPMKTPDDIFLREFWEENFGCKWVRPGAVLSNRTQICTGKESLGNTFTTISTLRVTYSVYIAVYALAWALQDTLSHRQKACSETPQRCGEPLAFQPWETKDNREVYFDSNGNLPAVYDIVNWQMDSQGTVRHVKVGSYDSSAKQGYKFMVNTSSIQWTTGDKTVPFSICSPSCPSGFRKAVLQGKPVCCFQCIPCPSGDISNQTDSVDCFRCPWDQWPNVDQNQCLPKSIEFLSHEDPLGTTLGATSIASSTIPVALLSLFIHYKSTPIVRANNYSLSCLLLVSLSLCFLSSLAFIGYPDPKKCLLRQAAFGMVFTLAVSCILAKTIMVVIAFKATKPGSSLRKWTGTKVSYCVIGLCVSIQLVVCVIWLTFYPPFPDHDIQSQAGVIVISCNEGSPTAFWCMLGYLGLLATISFVLAFLARRLPDSFNEAKFITFSMLAFLSVWVSYIPASLSARGKYTVAMEIFAILSSSWALVFCIFLPKCFIIIFRPELNTKNSLMGRGKK
ncbi:extracellular calcium-sensing receptor-like [Spea bombifrons]|uniref:extracellular calcium-sensing receptor-like n=1 Tax=Spea bombifrons TaxID=233779 RepID=UPI00234B9427|nr:extracellular calcium-sensing receptor-like [Spea bombifrons]